MLRSSGSTLSSFASDRITLKSISSSTIEPNNDFKPLPFTLKHPVKLSFTRLFTASIQTNMALISSSVIDLAKLSSSSPKSSSSTLPAAKIALHTNGNRLDDCFQ